MAKKFYYTRNPESIGGADARFQDDWGFKHKEDDIKWVNAELVDGLVEALKTIASGTEDLMPPFRELPKYRMQQIAKSALAALEVKPK